MAREVDVDVNLAELGLMDSLQIEDTDGTFRLAYSSPVNGEAMLRVGCDVSNSTSYSQMDRSKTESIFKDQLLFSQPSASTSTSIDEMIDKDRRSNTNQDCSEGDSLSASESELETKNLVMKCLHQTDKDKYVIAFDETNNGQDVKVGSAGLTNYLTTSLYRLQKNRQQQQMLSSNSNVNNNNSMNSNLSENNNNDSDTSGTLTYRTGSSSSPNRLPMRPRHLPQLSSHHGLTDDDDYHQQLGHPDEEILPVFDIQATSYTSHGGMSPLPNILPPARFSDEKQKDQRRRRRLPNVPSYSTDGSEEQSSYTSSAITSSPSDAGSPEQQQLQNQQQNRMAFNVHSNVQRQFYPSGQQQLLPPACLHALERLKAAASPIREEDEGGNSTTTDSSRADVDMISDGSSRGVTFGCDQQLSRQSSLRGVAGHRTVNVGGTAVTLRGKGGRRNLNLQHRHSSFESYHHYYHYGCGSPAGSSSSGHHNSSNYHIPHVSQRIRSAPQTPSTYVGYPSNMNCCPEPVIEPAPQPQEKIYVCFPNYSLPDLSFLLQQGSISNNSAQILLSPTKPMIRNDNTPKSNPVTPSNGKVISTVSNRKNEPSTSRTTKSRPKSFNDVDTLITESAIKSVKDWDSLSFLLPQEVKDILGAKGFVLPQDKSGNTKEPGELKNQTSQEHQAPPVIMRVRPQQTPTRREEIQAKRRSLQEPLYANPTNIIRSGSILGSNYVPQNYPNYHSQPVTPMMSCHTSSVSCHHHNSCCTGCRPMTMCCQTPPQHFHNCNHHSPPAAPTGSQSSHTDDSITAFCDLLSMQEEVREVTELLGRILSPTASSTDKSGSNEVKTPTNEVPQPQKSKKSIKPKSLPVNTKKNAGKSMIPIAASAKVKSPEVKPRVPPRRTATTTSAKTKSTSKAK